MGNGLETAFGGREEDLDEEGDGAQKLRFAAEPAPILEEALPIPSLLPIAHCPLFVAYVLCRLSAGVRRGGRSGGRWS